MVIHSAVTIQLHCTVGRSKQQTQILDENTLLLQAFEGGPHFTTFLCEADLSWH